MIMIIQVLAPWKWKDEHWNSLRFDEGVEAEWGWVNGNHTFVNLQISVNEF